MHRVSIETTKHRSFGILFREFFPRTVVILCGDRYGLITFLSIQISMRLESKRNSLIIESRSRENLNASGAHSDKAKSRRSTAYVHTRARSPACRIKAQQTSNTSSHAKQHAEACPPRRVVIPHRANRRIDPLWAHTSPRIRARNPAERFAGSTAGSRGETGEWRTRSREEYAACGRGRWERGTE